MAASQKLDCANNNVGNSSAEGNRRRRSCRCYAGSRTPPTLLRRAPQRDSEPLWRKYSMISRTRTPPAPSPPGLPLPPCSSSRVVFAILHPLFSWPIRYFRGTRTLSKNTNCFAPPTRSMGTIEIPGETGGDQEGADSQGDVSSSQPRLPAFTPARSLSRSPALSTPCRALAPTSPFVRCFGPDLRDYRETRRPRSRRANAGR